MTPSKPGDPSKGKPAAGGDHADAVRGPEAEVEAGAAEEAAATEAPAAEAEAEAPAPAAEAKPKRARSRARKAQATAAEPAAGEPVEPAEPAAAGEPVVAGEPAEPAEPAAAGEPVAAGEPAEPAEPAAAEEPASPPEPARRPQPAAAPRRVGGGVVVRAQAKYVRTSARKARLVADHVRGKSVQEARAILAHTPRAAARDWTKVLESAVANAEHNHELVGDDLRIHAITADEGPTLKRFRPRAMGRAARIRKRTAHLTIQLTPKETR